MGLFRNRTDAALQLAEKLAGYKDKHPLILAIPRGGVPIAAILASRLDGELDVVLVHKLGAPGQPELAVGAVDEAGDIYLHPYAEELQVPEFYLEEEKLRQLHVLRKRRVEFTPQRGYLNPKGRTVIVVDDGIATGSTMAAALHFIRNKSPEELIVAVPVAAPPSLDYLKQQADKIVCLHTPEPFMAVGRFYDDFSQVKDEEVVELLSSNEMKDALNQ